MNLYRGIFNFPTKFVELYRHAKSEKHAWVIMCNSIANRDGVDVGIVCRMFDWEKNRDKFNIKTEIEFKEVADE
jgi:hypothetical protein